MATVNITINGRVIQAEAGATVLQAATAAGVTIPTLCHHPALRPEGVCRVCVVEVERQRLLQPACAFPVSEGLVIQTESERVVSARKMILELLFSQRPHYCMYCAQSGNVNSSECELQRLAYSYGLDCWRFSTGAHERWPVDSTHAYYIMDHNRCVLCRRCIRACNEVAANHTLGISGRGGECTIIADSGVPLGESTCISCGTCLQVCPTGALIDRRSAYVGHGSDMTWTKTTCLACPVGCGIVAVSRNNMLHRIEGDWDAANGGLLCVDGRFRAVEPPGERVSSPLLRRNGLLVEATWDEAVALATARLRAADTVAGLASARSTNEALAELQSFFASAVPAGQLALLSGSVPPLDLGARASLADLNRSDCIAIVGGDPLQEQKALGYMVKRAVDRGATLIIAGQSVTGFADLPHSRLALREIAQCAPALAAARHPVVLYAGGLRGAVYDALRALPAHVRFLPLVEGSNAVGAAQIGVSATPVRGDVLLIAAGDDLPGGAAAPEAAFTIVQAAYRSAWTERADVVFPARLWSETSGHVVNLEGRTLTVSPFIEAPQGAPTQSALLGMLAAQLANPEQTTAASR